MNIVNQDLVIVLQGFVKGYLNLESLKEWLAANIWNLSSSHSPLDRMILGELEIAMAEYDRGDRDDKYLHDHIKFLLRLPNPRLVPKLEETYVVTRGNVSGN